MNSAAGTGAVTRAVAAMALLATLGGSARADGPPCVLGAHVTRDWTGALARRVTLGESSLSLRVALERAASAAGVTLTYASDVVPPGRMVCANLTAVALGDVLVAWLDGLAEPVAMGGDQVALAPARPRAAGAPSSGPVPPAGGVELARVVVLAPAEASSVTGETTSRDVIDRDRIASHGPGPTSLAVLLEGVVPGTWLWSTGPASLLSNVGSLRGASSFGMSYPKIYVDGIEVANPLLLSRLVPEALEQVEVIRGPQGTALYGSDAIAGVIKITTRTAANPRGAGKLDLTSSAGYAGSAFTPLGALVQDHLLSFRAGTDVRSFASSVSLGSVGAYIPGASSRHLAVMGGGSLLGRNSRLQATARFQQQRVRTGLDLPLAVAPGEVAAATSALDTASAGSGRQALTSYAVGAQLTHAGDPAWTHTLTAGVDGYSLAGLAGASLRRHDAADSALLAAAGRADRGTVRLSSEGRFGVEGRRSGTVTLGLDHSLLREATDPLNGPAASGAGPTFRGSLGALAQASVELGRSVFINAGFRLEHNTGLIAQDLASALPSLGVAAVRQVGPASVKLRAAYGRAIRAPRVGNTRLPGHLSTLGPEQQDGVEFGADVRIGERWSLRATRFDQRASGLIQPVVGRAAAAADGSHGRRTTLSLQNVGEIANGGWEFQASGSRGAFEVTGTLGLVDSRVRRVAGGYTGDLRAGDRMLQVPSMTASLAATWFGRGWSSTLSLARAADWVNYDWAAYASDAETGVTPAPGATPGMRAYWTTYRGATRVRATFSRGLARGLALVFSGDNLLGIQRGEPDNVTIVPGRTVIAGLRATR